MNQSIIISGYTVEQDNTEPVKSQQDIRAYTRLLTNGLEYSHIQDAIYPEIQTKRNTHHHVSLKVESELPASLPQLGTHAIQETISAVNLSFKDHLEQVVALTVSLNGFSSVVAVKVSMPQCMESHPPVLGFWCAMDILSESAYLKGHDDDTRSEFQQLLGGLSYWATGLLLAMGDSEVKSKLKLLSLIESQVSLVSGFSGTLVGWHREAWLIWTPGRLIWAQSAEIVVGI